MTVVLTFVWSCTSSTHGEGDVLFHSATRTLGTSWVLRRIPQRSHYSRTWCRCSRHLFIIGEIIVLTLMRVLKGGLWILSKSFSSAMASSNISWGVEPSYPTKLKYLGSSLCYFTKSRHRVSCVTSLVWSFSSTSA